MITRWVGATVWLVFVMTVGCVAEHAPPNEAFGPGETDVMTFGLVLEHGVSTGDQYDYRTTVANINLSDAPVWNATLTMEWTPIAQTAERLGVEFWIDASEPLAQTFGPSPLVLELPGELFVSESYRYFANPITGDGVTLAVKQPVNITFAVTYAHVGSQETNATPSDM